MIDPLAFGAFNKHRTLNKTGETELTEATVNYSQYNN
jgi:hypothetical protein